MTNAEPFKDEQYEKSFQDIVCTASADPEDEKTLAVHMWEWGTRPANKGKFDADIHREEIDSALAVMANEEGVVYDDSKYGWGSRYQTCDGKNGMLALACTALDVEAPCRLYQHSVSGTGLLLNDSPLVLTAPQGVGSKYDERENLLLKSFSTHINGNPRDSYLHDSAASEHKELASSGRFNFKKEPNVAAYNEVCVNAKLEHVAGILVDGLSECVDPAADDATWQKYLVEHKEMAKRITLGFEEYDMVTAKFAEKGVMPNPVPTVVIYQPHAAKAEDRMVHFPPTEKNRNLVNSIPPPMSQHFELSGLGNSFGR